MKTDNYLTLCLEQAAKSPLRYRHGCIIVRGGKVIGQGHNDYRPGFDSGTLKHGRVAGSALNGLALAEMKAKMKERKENKGKPKKPQLRQQQEQHQQSVGGAQANNRSPCTLR
jgi:deoxycytidylate deaminase